MEIDDKGLLLIGILVQVVGYAVTVAGAIYGSIKGAREGAIEAYNRNKEAEHEREQKQIRSVRLLLGLEIKQNLDDLAFLLNGLKVKRGEGDDRYVFKGDADQEKQKSELFIERQRFIAAHYPKWGHHFWQGQQTTYMLPIALETDEIVELNFFHSQFDALSRIVESLSEEGRRQANVPHDSSSGEPSWLTPYPRDESVLWAEFLGTAGEIFKVGDRLIARLQRAQAESNESSRAGLTVGTAIPQVGESPASRLPDK